MVHLKELPLYIRFIISLLDPLYIVEIIIESAVGVGGGRSLLSHMCFTDW